MLASCALSVGWEPWQPYQLKVGDKVTGLDNDLFSAIAAQAGCVVTFKERPWKRILEEVKLGELMWLWGFQNRRARGGCQLQ